MCVGVSIKSQSARVKFSQPRRRLRAIFYAPVTQELTSLITDGDAAVAEWTRRARSVRGQAYENHYAVVFTVRDDRIVAVREYLDTEVALEILF